jgi:hypothetical protein
MNLFIAVTKPVYICKYIVQKKTIADSIAWQKHAEHVWPEEYM